MFRPIKNCLLLVSSLLFSLAALAQKDLLSQTSEVHNLLVQYEADKGSLTRFYFIPNSPERRQRFEAFTTEYLDKLTTLSFESMSTGGKVDYILFKRNLENELRLLNKEETEYEQVKKYIPFADGIYT